MVNKYLKNQSLRKAKGVQREKDSSPVTINILGEKRRIHHNPLIWLESEKNAGDYFCSDKFSEEQILRLIVEVPRNSKSHAEIDRTYCLFRGRYCKRNKA